MLCSSKDIEREEMVRRGGKGRIEEVVVGEESGRRELRLRKQSIKRAETCAKTDIAISPVWYSVGC
jgi:hypothetical protein